jgi:membrane-bound lytic murein transglycosylase A
MTTNSNPAPSASSKISHMRRLSRPGERPAPATPRDPATPRPGLWALAGLLVLLGACTSVPPPRGAPPPDAGLATSPPGTAPGTTSTQLPSTTALQRPRARWVPVTWSQLPGWGDDRASELWPALQAGCAKPAAGWAAVCARALAFNPPDDGFARDFLQRELLPYRVESPEGATTGLATGYFEPLLSARRQRGDGFTVALHRPPADLAQRRPWYTRQQVDTLPAAAAALRGQEIAWLASPLDLLVLQIQGSGRLRITEPDGRQRTVRVAFAGHNDQPYKSVGRWLIDQGELRADGASWPAIRDWGQRATPDRLQQMMWANPRLVFFREEAMPDEAAGAAGARGLNGVPGVPGATGPRGAQNVPLTAGRSVAVDPQAVPYGTPLWLDTTEPLSSTPLRRLVMAQDTGTAIVGAVRIDYFWGAGDQAEQQAGRMKQPLQLWALWPNGAP